MAREPTAPARPTAAARARAAAARARAKTPAGPLRSGRVRVPPPLISYRLPSGRGATEQPNATGDGEAALTPRFWAMVALTGVAAGLFGDLMMLLLFTVQHLAFGYHTGTLESGVEHASDTRRLVVLLIAGGVRRDLLVPAAPLHPRGEVGTRRRGVGRRGPAVLPPVARHLGHLRDRHRDGRVDGPGGRAQAHGRGVRGHPGRLGPADPAAAPAADGVRRGAGLAAVYNVPLGGALFTAEIMMGSISLPVVLPALACSGIATVTAWLYLPSRATYLDVPGYHAHAAVAGLGAARRAADRGDRLRLHPADRLGHPSPGQRPGRADRPAGGLRGARADRVRLPAAVRQREGHGPRRVPGVGRPGPAPGPVRAEAPGHGAVPGQRRLRGAVHADAEHRGGAGRRGRASPGAWPGRAHRRARTRW